jgi:molybdate transport system regulatory protein
MARKRTSRPTVTPRAKVWLEADGQYAFGLGIARILEAVDKTGSIKAAAAEVGKSYRHVWARIKAAEEALGIALVATQIGGGDSRRSTLTDPARQLVDCYTRLRGQVFEIVENQFSATVQDIVLQATKQAAAR